jgi:hypothetical protein
MKTLVFSYEHIQKNNLGIYAGLKLAYSENDLLNFVLCNLNDLHILDVIDINTTDEYEFIYLKDEKIPYKYINVEYYLNGDLMKKTIRNQQNILTWVDV